MRLQVHGQSLRDHVQSRLKRNDIQYTQIMTQSGPQPEFQNEEAPCERAPKARKSRRRVGWEWYGYPPPQPTRDLGERRELPQRGPGGVPAENESGAFGGAPEVLSLQI